MVDGSPVVELTDMTGDTELGILWSCGGKGTSEYLCPAPPLLLLLLILFELLQTYEVEEEEGGGAEVEEQ